MLNFLVANAETSKIANSIRGFIAPLFLLAIGLVALTFLMKRELTQFFQFVVLGIGVAVFFYFPNVLEGIAKTIAGFFGSTSITEGGKTELPTK